MCLHLFSKWSFYSHSECTPLFLKWTSLCCAVLFLFCFFFFFNPVLPWRWMVPLSRCNMHKSLFSLPPFFFLGGGSWNFFLFKGKYGFFYKIMTNIDSNNLVVLITDWYYHFTHLKTWVLQWSVLDHPVIIHDNKLLHWHFHGHHEFDITNKCLTTHDGNTYWRLFTHTTFSDLDFISRSQQFQLKLKGVYLD